MSNNPFDDIIRDISLTGAATAERAESNQLVISSRSSINNLLDRSSGSVRLKRNVVDKFSLILSQPLSVSVLNPFEIRCCLCGKVIMYPAWYHVVRYNVNVVHYFVCFNRNEPTKVTSKCYRVG